MRFFKAPINYKLSFKHARLATGIITAQSCAVQTASEQMILGSTGESNDVNQII